MTESDADKCCSSRRDKRRRAILDAARTLFLKQGYSATSLGDVVRLSGGSLATLYNLFGGKAGLFQAVVEEQCSWIVEKLDSADMADRPPACALHAVAERLIDLLLTEEGIGLLRVVVAEAPQVPEIGAVFLSAGAETARAKVVAYLAKQASRGVLSIEDPYGAATMFYQMVVGRYQLDLLCGKKVELTPEEKKRHLDFVVKAFMRICQPTV